MNFINNDFMGRCEKILYLKIFLVTFSLGIILLYIFSFYTANGDVLVNSHDNLDSNIAIYKLLADSGTFFSPNDTIIQNVMNGLPRAALPGEYNIVSMLYYFFKPVDAFIINEALIRLIAFFGMFLLLKKHFLNDKKDNEVGYFVTSIGTALVFSLLPYWSNGGASIAGQPFVIYAFLNIKNRDIRFVNWFILGAFPFYSSLILAGMFVLSMLVIILIYDWIKNRTLNFYLILVIAVMSVLYLFAEYRLLINILDPVYTPHRQEFVTRYLTYQQSLTRSADLFFYGQYHAKSIHEVFLLPFIFSSALILFFSEKINKYATLTISVFVVIGVIYFKDYYGLQWMNVIHEYIFDSVYRNYYVLFAALIATILLYIKEYVASYVLIAILSISLFSGFEDFQGFRIIKENIPILQQIKFDRFYFLFSFLWFLLFSLSSKIMLKKSSYSLLIIVIILLMQGSYSMRLHGAVSSGKLIGMERYYSYDVYNEVKKFINEPLNSYRVMNLGLPPSIAIYNGFYTLDAYLATYPLEYKHEFRKIIATELEKSEKMKNYFDAWGSRCKLVAEDKDITLNLGQFKDMGGRYIFSGYDVNINDGENVRFLQKFSNANSQYSVYLYIVK